MIVMAIIGILIRWRFPALCGAIKHAREAVLKEDLQTMRTAIDSYTMDKQKAPQSLDDLVQDGYLQGDSRRSDDPQQRYLGHRYAAMPCTRWIETEPGINDVHSGSHETGIRRPALLFLVNSAAAREERYELYRTIRHLARLLMRVRLALLHSCAFCGPQPIGEHHHIRLLDGKTGLPRECLELSGARRSP